MLDEIKKQREAELMSDIKNIKKKISLLNTALNVVDKEEDISNIESLLNEYKNILNSYIKIAKIEYNKDVK